MSTEPTGEFRLRFESVEAIYREFRKDAIHSSQVSNKPLEIIARSAAKARNAFVRFAVDFLAKHQERWKGELSNDEKRRLAQVIDNLNLIIEQVKLVQDEAACGAWKLDAVAMSVKRCDDALERLRKMDLEP